MGGLLKYAALGMASGFATGVAEAAQARRDAAVKAVERADRLAERQQDRQWQIEDNDASAAARARDLALSRSWQIEDRNSERNSQAADRKASQEAFDAAFQPSGAPPVGEQGVITPTANPAGLPEQIIGAVDTASPLGDGLARNESGGRFDAQNDAVGSSGRVGHFGRGQFSQDRLDDAKRAGAMPADMTPEQFMASPDAQKRVEQWHRDDILNFAQQNGLDRIVGRTFNGKKLTEQSLVNIAHLGGKEGLRRFVDSAGTYDPADGNGTRLSDYAAMGAEDEGARRQKLLRAAGNPALDSEQRKILIAEAEGPKPVDLPSSVEEYKFAQGQGYAGTFADFKNSTSKAGAASIVVNSGDDPSGTGAFYKTLDESDAKNFGAIRESAPAVYRTSAQIDQLADVLANVQTGGGAVLKSIAGEWGIPTDGLSDIQTAQALISQMIPSQRQPGSGTMSDKDIDLFKASLPRLVNQPGGNGKIISTMRAINGYDRQMIEITNRVANREITPGEARAQMMQVQNPLISFKAQEVPRVTSTADWDALPSGAQFRHSDGSLRRKP